VAYYRLYFLEQSGHIRGFEAFEAANDEAAISKAALAEKPAMELWCERRRVKQWR
jgi:hypothetical protein